METENKINCNCLDVVYDEKSKSLKNGKYATIDNTEKGDNIFIPVSGFDVNNNNLPYDVKNKMESNRKARPTTLAQNVVREDNAKKQQQSKQQQTRPIVEDRIK